MQDSARKDVVFGAAGVYPVTVPGPKWKSWLERHPRNRVILRLLYGAGLRVSELCGLKQRDCQPRDEAGQITIFGKGGKTRTVLLPVSVWQDLEALPGEASDPDAPVFRSRKKGGHTFGDFVSSLSICFLSLFVGREIIRTWILECNWAGSRQVEPLVRLGVVAADPLPLSVQLS